MPRSEYGKEYDFDAPVKLLDRMLHSMAEEKDQQVVVLSQVLAADLSIGYEDIVNTQVSRLLHAVFGCYGMDCAHKFQCALNAIQLGRLDLTPGGKQWLWTLQVNLKQPSKGAEVLYYPAMTTLLIGGPARICHQWSILIALSQWYIAKVVWV